MLRSFFWARPPAQLRTPSVKLLVYDTLSGNACEVTPLLARGGAEVAVLTHAATVRAGFAEAQEVFHQPISDTPSKTSPKNSTPERASLLQRLLTRVARKRVEAKRVQHLASAIQEHSPDAIIAMDAELGLPIALRANELAAKSVKSNASALRIPVFCNTKGSDVLVVPHRKPALHRLVSTALRQCAGVLIYTEPHREAVAALLGPDTTIPMWKIPPTRDLSRFGPNDAPREAAKARGEPPLVLCLRGTTPVYRPEVMVAAAAIASRSTPLRLRFMATVADAAMWRQVWSQYGGSPGGIEVLSQRISHESMPSQYAEATVVAQALLNESLGFTGIEAMACGRVVVQPDSEVAREILNPAQHDLLSGPDAESLAERLAFVLQHDEERVAMEASNRAYAVERFDERSVVSAAGRVLVAWLAQHI